ncbi:phage-related protein [Halorhodospira halochloris]|uniref:Phage-related protein n=1 Tax=Halorhodospira halochloris TaxID=1052 RepID=A0A0X8X9S9_HALHR|nr:YqaJ viral recombinase family protein [Halorhodospira halochloris]BAU58140.1 phage-related protein [Halorhodospira halochloris]
MTVATEGVVCLESRGQRSRAPEHWGQAHRLVETRDLDRATWLSIRRGGIGASEAAAVIGMHPYSSPLEVWLDKSGRQVEQSAESVDPQNPAWWGQLLEPTVADAYAQVTGRKVRRVNAILQHPEHPWMLCNLDREVVGDPDIQILEIKTTGVMEARRWRNGVPQHVQLQVQHQLAVTGQRAADVAVLIGGQNLEIHRIERDEDVIERLIALEQAFWSCVEADTPPRPDGSESSAQALRELYQESHVGVVVDFQEDAELGRSFAQLQRVREEIAERRRREDVLKQSIQAAMGEAEKAIFPTGTVTWKQSAPSNRVDTKALEADYPELVARYKQQVPGSRRFTIRD